MTRAPRPSRTGQGMTACGMQELFDPPEVLRKKVKQLAEMIRASKYTVVFTGAGISTSAGIPDYRGPAGVWTLKARGKEVAEPDFGQREPTVSHYSIKTLISRKLVRHVVSQNIDGLHRRSGIHPSQISELHGNYCLESCPSCGAEYFRSFAVWDGLTSAPGSTADSAATATKAALKLHRESDGFASKRLGPVIEKQVDKSKGAPSTTKSLKNKTRKSKGAKPGTLKLQAAEGPPYEAESNGVATANGLDVSNTAELEAEGAAAAVANEMQKFEEAPCAHTEVQVEKERSSSEVQRAGSQAGLENAKIDHFELDVAGEKCCEPRLVENVEGQDHCVGEDIGDGEKATLGASSGNGEADVEMAEAVADVVLGEAPTIVLPETALAEENPMVNGGERMVGLELTKEQANSEQEAQPEKTNDQAVIVNEYVGKKPCEEVVTSSLPMPAETDRWTELQEAVEMSGDIPGQEGLTEADCGGAENVERADAAPEPENDGMGAAKESKIGSEKSVLNAGLYGVDGEYPTHVTECDKVAVGAIKNKGEQSEPVAGEKAASISTKEELLAVGSGTADLAGVDREMRTTRPDGQAMEAHDTCCVGGASTGARSEEATGEGGGGNDPGQDEEPGIASVEEADVQPKEAGTTDAWLHETKALLFGTSLAPFEKCDFKLGGEGGDKMMVWQGHREFSKEEAKVGAPSSNHTTLGSMEVPAEKSIGAGRPRRTRAYLGPVSDLSGTKVDEALEVLRSRAGNGLPLQTGVMPDSEGQAAPGPGMHPSHHDHRTGRKCERKGCDGDLVDSVVLFGESMPPKAVEDAEQHSAKAEVALVLGSSLRVGPACDFPGSVPDHGGKLVIVNLQRTPMDKKASLVIHARCDDVMELLMAELGLPIKKPQTCIEPESGSRPIFEPRASNKAEAGGRAAPKVTANGKPDAAPRGAGRDASGSKLDTDAIAKGVSGSLKVKLRIGPSLKPKTENGLAGSEPPGYMLLGSTSDIAANKELIGAFVHRMSLVPSKKRSMTLAEAVARMQGSQKDGFHLTADLVSEEAGEFGGRSRDNGCGHGSLDDSAFGGMDSREGLNGADNRQMDGGMDTDDGEAAQPQREEHEPIVWRSYKRRRNSSEGRAHADGRGLQVENKVTLKQARAVVEIAAQEGDHGDLPTWARQGDFMKPVAEDSGQQTSQQGLESSLPAKQVICLEA